MDHNLSLVEPEYRPIVKILLEWEDLLSDDFLAYCESSMPENPYNDWVLTTLVEIAKDIQNARMDLPPGIAVRQDPASTYFIYYIIKTGEVVLEHAYDNNSTRKMVWDKLARPKWKHLMDGKI